MAQRFPSRIDDQFALTGVAVPSSLALVLLANGVLYGAPPLWVALPLLITIGVVVWLLTTTSYAFEGPVLLVRCGPLRWRVPLEQIFSVREIESARSAPAMSMDRLEIRFADDDLMLISPRDKAAFLRELHRQAPQLANHGRSAHSAI